MSHWQVFRRRPERCESIALVFDATNSGAIFMTDLELLRTDMMHAEHPKSDTPKLEYVTHLEAAYGAPSQEGFGSAVFYERLKASDDLEQAAFAKYRYFVGEQWERFGEDAWMGPWKVVYTRQPVPSRTSWPSCAASRTRTQRTRRR